MAKTYSIANSEAAFLRARQLMPGGVSSPVRSFNSVGGTPVFIKEAQGAILTDVDDNQYVDYIGAYGPQILGHVHENVVAALSKTIGRGTAFGTPTEAESQLATLILSALPGMEMIRFVNSGTEATMSALRLARGATGRDKIVKCIGCYHGHVDALLAKAGSGVATFATTHSKTKAAKSQNDESTPSSPGVPAATTSNTLLVPYNDLKAAEALFKNYKNEIACFAVEPVAGNMGVVPPMDGYLQGLRDFCSDNGTLLLFDEVMTGFRVAWGGAQRLYNIAPDITCLGKVIGGGLPVGAYAASKKLMEQISPSGPVYQAGTLSGNPMAMAAGLATLEILQEQNCYENLNRLSQRLATGLVAAAKDASVPLTVNRVGSMITPFFVKKHEQLIQNFHDATSCDIDRFSRFFHAMLEGGVYLPPSQFEAWFVSLAHTDELIDQTIKTARRVFKNLGA